MNNIIIVDDIVDFPNHLVALQNGKVIKKEERVFQLVKHPKLDGIELAHDATYKRLPDGSLRRLMKSPSAKCDRRKRK